jgi:hypothetical protein
MNKYENLLRVSGQGIKVSLHRYLRHGSLSCHGEAFEPCAQRTCRRALTPGP